MVVEIQNYIVKFKSVEDEVFSETTAYDYYLVWKKLNDYRDI